MSSQATTRRASDIKRIHVLRSRLALACWFAASPSS